MNKLFVLAAVLCLALTAGAYEGYEPQATGGSGGTTVHVTNLNDSGTGSLRAAVAGLTGSPTIIVFDVNGVICVSSEIRITKANVTIDGTTAPGNGITVAGAPGTQFGIDVNGDANAIIKHVRFRNAGLEDLQVWEGGLITIDHCSFSGSGDGALDINTANHMIISRCIFAGCVEVHKAHGTYVTSHHNLYAWNNRRQPRVYQGGPYWDFRNNIMEFWTNTGTNILSSDAVNIVNNWYGNPAPGAGCTSGFWSINASTNVYTGGNYSLCGQNIDAMGNKATPNTEPNVTTTDATTAYNSILADVGAQPNDAIDQYYIAGGGTSPPPLGACSSAPILEWVGPNGTASPWETAANWYDLGTGAARVPTSADVARVYNALGIGFTNSNVTVSSTTAICLKLQMRYLITKLTVLTGGKLTTTGSVEMHQGTSAQLDIQAGATMDACTKANTSAATFKVANDGATTGPATVNIWGTLNIVSLNPTNGTSDLQICNVSGGTGTGTININSTGVLNTEAYTIGSYGTGRIYVYTGGTMKVTGNVTTQVNADIAAGKIAGGGGATLSVSYNSGENKTYVTASGGGGGGGEATFFSPDVTDGYVKESSETSGVGGYYYTTSTYVGDDASRRQCIAILHFDTSSIPDTATITSATLSIRRLGKYGDPTSLGTITVDIKSGYYGTSESVRAPDFEAASSATNVATLPFPAANGDWSTGSLNSSGLSNINKTSTTQFKVRFTLDDDNDGTADQLNIYDGGDPPQLHVIWQ